jgi:hypothetical protein
MTCQQFIRCEAPPLVVPTLLGDAAAVAALMFLEHEKKTFFSSLAPTRSEDGGQGRAFFARSSQRSGDP